MTRPFGKPVLARTLVEHLADGRPGASIAGELTARFAADLEPHFQMEEEILLPALHAVGESALAQRTREDHLALRRAVGAIENGDHSQIAGFAERLTAHVRFEERELFPRCEACLPDEVLEEVSRRATRKVQEC
jgi:hemerythrin-like domain-containing protein